MMVQLTEKGATWFRTQMRAGKVRLLDVAEDGTMELEVPDPPPTRQ